MKLALLAALLVLPTSALAQAPVYTNADLATPRSAIRAVLPAAEYAGLLANQFVCACGLPRDDRNYSSPAIPPPTPIVNHTLQRPSWETPWSMWRYTGRNPFIPAYGVTVGGVTVATSTVPIYGGRSHRRRGR